MPRLALVLCLPFLSLVACAKQGPPPPPHAVHPPPAPEQIKPALPSVNLSPGYTLLENAALCLEQSGVAEDLKLTKQQSKTIAQTFVDADTKSQTLTKQYDDAASADKLAAAIDKLGKDTVDTVLAQLSESQTTRLKQVALQSLGWNAFRLDEVRKETLLAPDQTAALDKSFKDLDLQVEDYAAELGDKMSKLKQPGSGASDDEWKAFHKAQSDVTDGLKPKEDALAALEKKDSADFFASLNATQQDKWKAMQGRPFAV